jgi:glycosyltransferase involved in cell wall biosynthesis
LDVNTTGDVEVSPGVVVRYCHRVTDVSVSPTLLRLLFSQVKWADVVHLTAVYSFPTIPTLLICKILRKPVVWSPRGMLQRWKGTNRIKLKAIWERACLVVAPDRLLLHATSRQEARETEQRLRGVQTVVVPNGIDIPDTIRRGEGSAQLRLAYLGRLDPKKGIENLLTAYQMVHDNLGRPSSLVIAGSGEQHYLEKIEAQVQKLGLSQHVKLVGHLAGHAKQRLFESTDVLVVPSHTENFGMVVAEALAHGVPVITSRGTPWKQVEEIGCGFWVDNEPNILAAAIRCISSMPLQEMGLRGRRWMQEEFAWEPLGRKMADVYRRLVPTLQ